MVVAKSTNKGSRLEAEASTTNKVHERSSQSGNGDELLKSQIELVDAKVSFVDLYRYASTKDWTILAISSVFAIAAGGLIPCFPLLFGDMATLFQAIALRQMERRAFDQQLEEKSLILVYLGLGSFVAYYVATAGFMWIGERLTNKIRHNYFQALLRQNVGLFDKVGAGALSGRISLECQTIQDGISEKVGFTIIAIATLVSALIIGFVSYWKLTLVATVVVVVIVGAMAISMRFIARFMLQSFGKYAAANNIAQEALGSIATVKILTAENDFAKKYEKVLLIVEKSGRKAQLLVACMVTIIMSSTSMSHALIFWSGSIFVSNGESSVGDVITVAFAIIIASHVFGQMTTFLRLFASATAAASKIYSVIDRMSPLDPHSTTGVCPETVSGRIVFSNIKHRYPSRPEQTVLDVQNLTFEAGKTTAIVGSSGSGKSTIVNLIERFYMPAEGTILLDDHDIASLSLKWLRRQIGFVSQEPVLFGISIAENIAQGQGDVVADLEDSTLQKQVEEAARLANAHDFILSLPQGYATVLGEGGTQLSGGQKQRIAIARALIGNPSILLLDEATSALDSYSEKLVKDAVKTASRGRTTILIAHRLSTIMDADNIIVLSNGSVVEQGSHAQLMDLEGAYSKLVQAQQLEVGLSSTGVENADVEAPNEKAAKSGAISRSGTTTALIEQESAQESKEQSLWKLFTFVASFNKPERKLIAVALCFSILAGCAGPTLAFLLAKAIAELSRPTSVAEEIREATSFWALLMFVVGLTQVINLGVQGSIFAYCSEKLALRARTKAFKCILAKEISWFDVRSNTSGALASTLGAEAKSLAGVSGATLGTILTSLTNLVVSFIVAMTIGWKLALVCSCTIPVLLGCGFYRVWMIAKFAQRSRASHQQGSAFASEGIRAIRTVASLGLEGQMIQKYAGILDSQDRKSRRAIMKSSIPFAGSQSCAFFCVALAFWYGGRLVADGEYSIFQFFLCFAEVIFGAQAAGMVFSFATEMGKARSAAQTYHDLIRTTPSDRTSHAETPDTEKASYDKVHFDNVSFRYPARPEHKVLESLDLHVKNSQQIAVVGRSGCGKSTIFALIERLYRPNGGTIRVCGKPIEDVELDQYRQQFGYVGQEPTLYSGSITDNLVLGLEDLNDKDAQDRITQACKEANIYEFVSSLPEGFDTAVGDRGVTLSGGQKQRIAIARALMRRPEILLLDEATSALDSSSEKVVQEALQDAARSRTTISVSHRLSTVQKADLIVVLDQGRIVEQGSHARLIELGGLYSRLAKAQDLKSEV